MKLLSARGMVQLTLQVLDLGIHTPGPGLEEDSKAANAEVKNKLRVMVCS